MQQVYADKHNQFRHAIGLQLYIHTNLLNDRQPIFGNSCGVSSFGIQLSAINAMASAFHFSKRIITVGAVVPSTSHVIIASRNLAHESRVRVSCGHCNEIFIVSNFLFLT